MFQPYPWPSTILHLDADAFFASVAQAVNPLLKGKPVVIGRERGIVTSFSYEAKKMGIIRGMAITAVKKNFPQCKIVDSDYELYQMFSQKINNLLKSFFPEVEQYSVDEWFVDLKGLRRPLNMSYEKMGKEIKNKIEQSLGLTVSIGIAPTKSLAKLASGFQKPSGFTVVNGLEIESFLKNISLEKVWGIGEQTKSYLQKLGLKNALDFTLQKEGFIIKHLAKPYLEIWHELRGKQIYLLNPKVKTTYKGMTKSLTFYPPTDNFDLLWSHLTANVEAVFKRLRRFRYQTSKVFIFLKTQDFNYKVHSLKLAEQTAYPFLIKEELKRAFIALYQKGVLYRATGIYLTELEENKTFQPSLFIDETKRVKAKKFQKILEQAKIDFGTSLFTQGKTDNEVLKRSRKMALPMLHFSSLQ